MNDPLTTREFIKTQKMKALFTVDHKWFTDSLIVVAVVLGLILLQPFGLDEIGAIQRIAYWVFISVIGYCLYGGVFIFGGCSLAKLTANWPYPLPTLLLAVIASVLMTCVVIFAGVVFFDIQAHYSKQFLIVFPQALTITLLILAVTIAIDYIREQNRRLGIGQDRQGLHELAVNAFLQNIPIDKRGELLCIKTNDHYLEVHTHKGHYLLLMRLRDALEILENANGGQVHRSWWVADSAVTKAVRNNRKISLILKNNITVPVSRKFVSDVKKRNIFK